MKHSTGVAKTDGSEELRSRRAVRRAEKIIDLVWLLVSCAVVVVGVLLAEWARWLP